MNPPDVTIQTLLLRFGVALFIGILVGLQREFSSGNEQRGEQALGVRTFSFFALAGCAGASVSSLAGSAWILCTVIVSLTSLLAVNYIADAAEGRRGLTTKAASLLTVLLGALCYYGHLTLAVALGVGITALLSVKIELHTFAHRLTRSDIFATLKFAAITAIVLPVLPNRSFGTGPFAIFNPFKIWLFVVLVSAISFVGYVLMKIVGPHRGIGLIGILGGLASSTAVTFSFAAKSRENPTWGRTFALSILIAWTVMYARVVVAVIVLNPDLAMMLVLPMSIPIVLGLASAVLLYLKEQQTVGEHHYKMSNPFELGPAIKFGMLFVLILFASRAAQLYFGDTGVYVSGFFAGLADVDAIALSMARLSAAGSEVIGPNVAARAIIIATVANTIVKGIVASSAASSLRRALWPGFAIMVAGGVTTIFFVK